MRLALLMCLVDEPEMLLLDEPTNPLDFAMPEWLEERINSYPGAVIIVSHDRMFIDRTIVCIMTFHHRIGWKNWLYHGRCMWSGNIFFKVVNM